MQKYRNGKEAAVGDKVIHRDMYGNIMTGRVIEVIPGTTTSNILTVPVGTPTTYLTAGDCLTLDDAIPKKEA